MIIDKVKSYAINKVQYTIIIKTELILWSIFKENLSLIATIVFI